MRTDNKGKQHIEAFSMVLSTDIKVYLFHLYLMIKILKSLSFPVSLKTLKSTTNFVVTCQKRLWGFHKGCPHLRGGSGLATMRTKVDRGREGSSCKWTSFSEWSFEESI